MMNDGSLSNISSFQFIFEWRHITLWRYSYFWLFRLLIVANSLSFSLIFVMTRFVQITRSPIGTCWLQLTTIMIDDRFCQSVSVLIPFVKHSLSWIFPQPSFPLIFHPPFWNRYGMKSLHTHQIRGVCHELHFLKRMSIVNTRTCHINILLWNNHDEKVRKQHHTESSLYPV